MHFLVYFALTYPTYSVVFGKFIAFTFAMVLGPIAAYFASTKLLFNDNSTYGALVAVVVANAVAVLYVFAAYKEDQQAVRPKQY